MIIVLAVLVSQSNGKAESAVKEAKKILVKCKKAGSDAYLALLDHRNTPPTGIQISPAQRLLNRRTRSLLPMSAGLLKPSVADEDTNRTKLRLRKQQQARYYNRGARDLDPLAKGDPVRVKPWEVGKKEWQKGVVKKRLDERSYEVELPQGVLRRNRVHLRRTNESAPKAADTQDEQCNEPQPQDPVSETHELPSQTATEAPSQGATEVHPPATPVKAPELRRSQRVRRVPKHLEDYVYT